MKEQIAIIYAHRDRDIERIELSFKSLFNQSSKNFEVIFVDYGSDKALVDDLKKLTKKYDFVTSYFLPVSQLLWNKSKALNYGILQTEAQYIFIADVDIIFHPKTIAGLHSLKNLKKFYLFNLSYLDKKIASHLKNINEFQNIKVSRIGEVNGMILAPRDAILKINGFDEFYHFYGAEDVDLFCRLETAGYIKEQDKSGLFYHLWHKSFQSSEDSALTKVPRLRNIMRINHEHHFRNRDQKIIKPLRQDKIGEIIDELESKKLETPTLHYNIPNISARVEHFLYEELNNLNGEIVKINFIIDPYYETLKYKLKVILGLQTQPYLSLKEINDILLKKILFNYRDENYSYHINADLRSIEFTIEL